MKIGDKVHYRGKTYFVVSRPFGGLIDIAPAKHGAGSFMVLISELVTSDQPA